jgi:hypothetical protein
MQSNYISIEELKSRLSRLQELSTQIEVLNDRDSDAFKKQMKNLEEEMKKLSSSSKVIEKTGFWSKANYVLGYLVGYDSNNIKRGGCYWY